MMLVVNLRHKYIADQNANLIFFDKCGYKSNNFSCSVSSFETVRIVTIV